MADGDGFPPLREINVPKPNWKLIASLLIGFLLIMAIWSSAFTVQPKEVGVVLRFGEYQRQMPPGLSWKLPFPIETVQLVSVLEVHKREYGFRTEVAGVRTRYSTRDFSSESLMLCGDRNVADVEWVAQYIIKDARNYLFRVRNVVDTFDDLNESVMREVIGDRSVTEVLTIGRNEIETEVKQKLAELCDAYETGIEVQQILLQDVNPPDPVKASFNEVNKAQQEREQLRNEAETRYKNVIPKARGEAEQTIAESQGYATDRVNRAKGDVAAFTELLSAYHQYPEVTRTRMFLETLEAVLPQMKNKVIVDSELKGVLPLLQLNQRGDR